MKNALVIKIKISKITIIFNILNIFLACNFKCKNCSGSLDNCIDGCSNNDTRVVGSTCECKPNHYENNEAICLSKS